MKNDQASIINKCRFTNWTIPVYYQDEHFGGCLKEKERSRKICGALQGWVWVSVGECG